MVKTHYVWQLVPLETQETIRNGKKKVLERYLYTVDNHSRVVWFNYRKKNHNASVIK